MWSWYEVRIEIEEAEGRTAVVTVHTPAGTLELVAELELTEGTLWIRNAHIQGLSPGALGRAGLNSIARKFLEEAGARALVVDGAARTTGARPDRRPRPFRFPR